LEALELVNAMQINDTKNGTISRLLLTAVFFVATTIQAAAATLPTDGLVLHVEADSGVTTQANTIDVTGWADQSGQGNDLTGSGNPQLIAGALNGEAIISFDGVNDIVERLADVSGLPAGNTDRTMYTVVKYDSLGYGGVAYGAPAANETFGLIVGPLGTLFVQGWVATNDFNSGVAGTNMGWMVQSAMHAAGTMTHYQDGEQIDLRVHAYGTNPIQIVLGAEIDRLPFMNMDIAAVLIYDRALTAGERADVEKYFSIKYFGGVDVNITSPTEGETVSSGDVTVMYEAEGKTFAQVRLVLDGGTPVDLDDAVGSHTFNGVAAGAHTLTATLIDANGQPLALDDSTATVNFAAEDCFPDDFAPNCTVDTDGDGTPDSAEGATTDSDGDGNLDYLESSVTDADNDGTPDQSDPNDANACIPSSTGNGCAPPPPPPPPPSSGGGSFGLAWLIALGGVLAVRRRRNIAA
jgi:MYXO-CTERM domain-containing protein